MKELMTSGYSFEVPENVRPEDFVNGLLSGTMIRLIKDGCIIPSAIIVYNKRAMYLDVSKYFKKEEAQKELTDFLKSIARKKDVRGICILCEAMCDEQSAFLLISEWASGKQIHRIVHYNKLEGGIEFTNSLSIKELQQLEGIFIGFFNQETIH